MDMAMLHPRSPKFIVISLGGNIRKGGSTVQYVTGGC